MDALTSSCYSLSYEENQKALQQQRKQEEKFQQIMASSGSLSRYEGRKFKTLLPQILAAILAGSFHIVFGISMAYSAILLPQLEAAANSTNPDDFTVNETEKVWLASVIVIVAPIGALFGGFIMDHMGRLNLIRLATIPSGLGWLLIATASDVKMIIIGRFLTGISSAWGTSPAIVYTTEIARPDMRGSLISVAPAYTSLGMVLGYLKGWIMSWRLVAWTCLAYTIAPVFLLMLVPESPAWLVSKGKMEQALKSLQWLNKYQPQPDNRSETFADLQLAALQKEDKIKKDQQAELSGTNLKKRLMMFLEPTGYKPLLMLTGLFVFQQYSGTYVTLFYAVTFFQDVGTNINPYLASIFLGTVRFGMSLINTWLMKQFGRRTLMTASALGMALCMGVSGLFTKWIHEGTTTLTWVPVLMLVFYVCTSMVGLLSIPWTIIAELFPIAIRGVAHSIGYSLANIIMFAAIQSYYKLDRLFGGSSGLQFFFGAVSLGGLVYSYVFLPETHNLKLSDIEKYFLNHSTYLSVLAKKKHTPSAIDIEQRVPIVKRNSNIKTNNANNENGTGRVQDKV